MRRSRRMSPSEITCLPTVTATRSRISACTIVTSTAIIKARVINKSASLISLTQGEVELEQVNLLRRQHPLVLNQLFIRARESIEARRIGAEAEVGANRTDGGAITDSEADRLNRIIEILNIVLAETKADVVDILVDIAHIVEQHASEIVADEGKSYLCGMKKNRFAADRKPRLQVARPGLVIGKSAIRGRASGIPTLSQGDLRESPQPLNVAELQVARDHDVLANRMVGGVANQQPREVRLRCELALR